MPHKKAKRTVRAQEQKDKGSNWAPGNYSVANEPIPKSASRILDAQKIREAYKIKKRKLEEEQGQGRNSKRTKTDAIKILPGESMEHFSRRVEDDLRPLVKTAMETGRAVARKVVKEEIQAKKEKKSKPKDKAKDPAEEPEEVSKSKPKPETVKFDVNNRDRPTKDFVGLSSSTPRRLNDVAQAPPEFKKAPTRQSKVTGPDKSQSVVSMAQKVMLDQERLKAIARYRELKAMRKHIGDEHK
ncbi:hypothetical protein FA15DRAFT_595187 [Coprinopsis marcescibilis]|uniref:Uncharacterized protein n=1 Tax=Coprinopsis marcescibilis TaxID=230819 RepID=A0A5C3KQT5_COPMA|nr:hypothetical protein FA15DRAFT_595187 [Coprinopsis marcescibilis]